MKGIVHIALYTRKCSVVTYRMGAYKYLQLMLRYLYAAQFILSGIDLATKQHFRAACTHRYASYSSEAEIFPLPFSLYVGLYTPALRLKKDIGVLALSLTLVGQDS